MILECGKCGIINGHKGSCEYAFTQTEAAYLGCGEYEDLKPDKFETSCEAELLTQGQCLKYDKDKLDWSMIPFPTLQEVVKVFHYGANKYAKDNWKSGTSHSRAFASMLRHLLAWYDGEDIDPESGLYHLAHLGAQTLMLADNIKRGTAIDDRDLR